MGLEINKFFFCIPLKAGLLLYGYINLIVWSIITTHVIHNESRYEPYKLSYKLENMYNNIILAMGALDSIFSILLLFGVHLSRLKCLKIFYWYKVIVFIPIFIVYIVMNIHSAMSIYDMQYEPKLSIREEYYNNNDIIYLVASILILLVVETATTVYLLLAVKSYFTKLERATSDDLENLLGKNLNQLAIFSL